MKRIKYLPTVIFIFFFLTVVVNAQTSEDSFNSQPFKDLAVQYGAQILGKSLDLDAPFAFIVTSRINEYGKLINPKLQIQKSGNLKTLDLAKSAVAATSDSQVFKPFYDAGARSLIVSINQDEENFQTTLEFDFANEAIAHQTSSAFNLMLSAAKDNYTNADDKLLLDKMSVYPEAKTVTVKFIISHSEKDQIIKRKLAAIETN